MRPSTPTPSTQQTVRSRSLLGETAPSRDQSDTVTITEPTDLLVWLLSYLDSQEPSIPLDDEAITTIKNFCQVIRCGRAPDHMHLFLWDGFNNVSWHALNDDGALLLPQDRDDLLFRAP